MAVVASEAIPIPRELRYWLNKPIQYPPSGPFDSDKIEWFMEEALLPADRLDDFIAGEGSRKEVACTFTKRRTDDLKMVSGKCTTYYWCCYGPEDSRVPQFEKIPDARGRKGKGPGSRPLAAYRSLGLSQQRGCRSHFQVYKFKARSDVALVKWTFRRHVDKSGNVCHGLHDQSALACNAVVAPHLTKKCRDYVERLLRTGVQPREIMRFHVKHLRTAYGEVTNQESFSDRDLQLTMTDVRNIRQRLRNVLHNYHPNDAIATKMWVEKNAENVILYQPGNQENGSPFILVFASEWMMKNLASYGHEKAVAIDATFGSNSYGFYFFTILCYDEFQNGLPCCWALMARHEAGDIELLLKHVRDRATELRQEKLKLQGEWTPSCVIVDDSCEEQLAIRNVFHGVPILLCFWHVRRCWLKHLVGRVQDPVVKAEMNRALGDIMYTTSEDAEALSIAFMEKYREQASFVQYYRANWHGRIDKWSKDFRKFCHNNQETNGAVERWHRTFKTHLRVEKKFKSGRRVSWLLHVLMDEIESLYWTLAQLKRQGRVCNRIVQKYALTAIQNARSIPDDHVIFEEIAGRSIGFVKSQSNPEKIHEVVAYDTDVAGCTCSQATQGNVCKHQIKCLLLKGYTEAELLHKLGSAFGSLAGGLGDGDGDEEEEEDDEDEEGQQQDNNHDLNTPTEGPLLDLNEPAMFLDIESASDDAPSAENLVLESVVPQATSKLLTKADLHTMVDKMWESCGSDADLVAQMTVLLTDANETLNNLIARKSSLEAVNVAIEPFVAIHGNENTLRRKPDFLESILCHSRKRRVNNSGEESCRTEVAVPHFTRKVQRRESIQQSLDSRALLSLDLNAVPIDYSLMSPVVTSSKRKK